MKQILLNLKFFLNLCFVALLLSISISVKAQNLDSKVTDSISEQCPCNGPALGRNWSQHLQYVECVTKAAAKMVENHEITSREAALLVFNATKSDCGNGSGGDSTESEDSPGDITLSGASESTFNPHVVNVTFHITGAKFSTNPDGYSVHLNGTPTSVQNFNVTSLNLSFTITLNDGLNDLSLYASDEKGQNVEGHYNLWSGSHSLPVTVVDKNGNLISNANVKIALSDDTTVIAEGKTVNGQITFANVPVRTLIATALAPDNSFGTAATVGNGSSIIIKLSAFNAPSNVDNNDISLGVAGWDIGTAPVSVIPHEEGIPTFKSTNKVQPADEQNNDLYLSTLGEGEQKMSRTFTIKAGTKNVSLRYRFITSEVPGGYFGSQFNDYYSVSIRSKSGGEIKSEQNSMNGLGLNAFDFSSGATAWKEIALPVSVKGDVVQVDVVVANVADGLFDSHVVVDFISENDLSIGKTTLIDPDKTNTLTYLSIDNQPYFNGKVRIYGKIIINGASDDKLTALNLEVLKDGNIISSTPLSTSAQSSLFQTFGSDEKVEIASTTLLFEIPSMSPLEADGKVLLRLRAETEKGQSITKDYASIPNLRLYKGTNRYGKRDDNQGGDGWGRPSTIAYTGMLNSTWTIGDLSNMNGNVFPQHSWHKDGIDIDAYFPNYGDIDQATANTLISFLNSTLGSSVDVIFVAYEIDPSDEFYTTIKDVTLNDGRKATDVIRPDPKHDTHFHIRLKVNNSASQQLIAPKNMIRKGIIASAGNNEPLLSNLLLFPNPSSGIINLSLKKAFENSKINLKEICRVAVYNKLGKVEKVVNYSLGTKSVQLNLSLLPYDRYVIEVTDGINKATIPMILSK